MGFRGLLNLFFNCFFYIFLSSITAIIVEKYFVNHVHLSQCWEAAQKDLILYVTNVTQY